LPPPPRPRAPWRGEARFILCRLGSNRGVPTTQCSPPDPEGKPAKCQMICPQKMLDYHMSAVSGMWRRRSSSTSPWSRRRASAAQWKILGPEWLKQLCRMKISEASSFALPRTGINWQRRTHAGCGVVCTGGVFSHGGPCWGRQTGKPIAA
jgi:hypothetical protein